jgi:nitroreductase
MEKLIETAGVPQGQKVAALIALGYPAETPGAPRRKEVKDILSYL